jgi:hypothetical protein
MLRQAIVRPAAVLGILSVVTPVCQAAGNTARSQLAQAQQAAGLWQADATLTRVGTTSLQKDGAALVWEYDFLSPSTVTCARVSTGTGEARVTELAACSPAKTVPGDFVDSPAAIKAAIKAGFQPGETSFAYLSYVDDSALPYRECWVLYTTNDFDAQTIAMHAWCVDPKTGDFIGRLSGQKNAKKR